MGEKIPRARLSVVEGAGHAVHLERPGDIATLLGA
jgi:pimeloyl-ACP methyl ester carboxylesterase